MADESNENKQTNMMKNRVVETKQKLNKKIMGFECIKLNAAGLVFHNAAHYKIIENYVRIGSSVAWEESKLITRKNFIFDVLIK